MPEQLDQLKRLDQPSQPNNALTAIKIALPIILVIGGLMAAWFLYPPLQQAAGNVFGGSAPQVEPELALPAETGEPATPDTPTEPVSDAEEPERRIPPTATERDQLRYREISLIRLALTDYYKRNNEYPPSLDEMVPEFLTRVPEDPQGIHPYKYQLDAGGYSLEFVLEGDIANLAAGRHTLTPVGYDAQPPSAEPPPTEGEPDVASTANASTVPIEEAILPDPGQDTDGDGLTDVREEQLGSDPNQTDTDGDGLTDGEEVNLIGTNPLLADSDGDGFTDLAELNSGYDPTEADKELADTDGDGLWDLVEITRGLNPNSADMDSDGLADGDELNVYGTDPRQSDTDGDGFDDGDEVVGNYNPLGPGAVSGDQASAWRANQDQYGLHEPTLTTLTP
jgi:hypothetical protein